jgi:hypothetical protein
MFKVKVGHTPMDFELRLEKEADSGGWFTLWTYDTWSKRTVVWDKHGLLFVPRDDLPRLNAGIQASSHGGSAPRRITSMKSLSHSATNHSIGECILVPQSSSSSSSASDEKSSSSSVDRMKFMLINLRDKHRPNTLVTVLKTIDAIKQNLTLSRIYPATFFMQELLPDVASVAHNFPDEAVLTAYLPATPEEEQKLADDTRFPMTVAKSFLLPPDDPRLPPSWRVLRLRELHRCKWNDPCSAADNIPIPVPDLKHAPDDGVKTLAQLRAEHAVLCQSWSIEGTTRSMRAK